MASLLQFQDLEPTVEAMREEVVRGLRQTPKQLSAKFLYDGPGALLYENICRTEDYYLTRTELAIMRDHIAAIAACLGEKVLLIEFGSGNSLKTRVLFDHLPRLAGYVPIDISRRQLLETSENIARDYPHIEVLPVCADYAGEVEIPSPASPFSRRLIYYPGSTIGNMVPRDAMNFLRRMRGLCQPGDALLIGVDLRKDPEIVWRAYNDRDGASTRFRMNILQRMNRELGADFAISQFRPVAVYNEVVCRVEAGLMSLCDQQARIGDELFSFNEGELVQLAVAYKYSPEGFRDLALEAGWRAEQLWKDERNWFSVQYLTAMTS